MTKRLALVLVLALAAPLALPATASAQKKAPAKKKAAKKAPAKKKAAKKKAPTKKKAAKKKAAPAAAAPAAGSAISVKRFVFAAAIESRKPTGVAERFAQDGKRLYAYLVFVNKGARQKVTVRWQRGKRRIKYNIGVGRSPHWRTWTYLRRHGWTKGTWTVTILDEKGAELSSKTVTIGS